MENKFVAKGRMEILAKGRVDNFLEAKPWRCDVNRRGFVLREVRQMLDGFGLDKEESSFESAMLNLVKARDHFLRIWKKIPHQTLT